MAQLSISCMRIEMRPIAATAPPALINAILDALPKGATLDMPATPDRIWQTLQKAK